MMSHTVILSVLINLLESISQYDISHSDIVSNVVSSDLLLRDIGSLACDL
jgi:hypothetical protein